MGVFTCKTSQWSDCALVDPLEEFFSAFLALTVSVHQVPADVPDQERELEQLLHDVDHSVGVGGRLHALAIRHGLAAEDLKSTMFAYPTDASAIGYML